jgi:hypothetical protein
MLLSADGELIGESTLASQPCHNDTDTDALQPVEEQTTVTEKYC